MFGHITAPISEKETNNFQLYETKVGRHSLKQSQKISVKFFMIILKHRKDL